MSALVLDSKGHEEFPEAEVQAAVKKRRTAVERAEESLEKAKARVRDGLLRKVHAKLLEAFEILDSDQVGNIDMRSDAAEVAGLVGDAMAGIRRELVK